MKPLRFADLVAFTRPGVRELFPWDLRDLLDAGQTPLLVDIREPYEYAAMHIPGSLNVPRGILESACEWDYEETVPELVRARDREIVIVCRSGNRSILAAHAMQVLGYQNVVSLATGLRGWKDFEQPLVAKGEQEVDLDDADEYFTPRLRPEQFRPKDEARA